MMDFQAHAVSDGGKQQCSIRDMTHREKGYKGCWECDLNGYRLAYLRFFTGLRTIQFEPPKFTDLDLIRKSEGPEKWSIP